MAEQGSTDISRDRTPTDDSEESGYASDKGVAGECAGLADSAAQQREFHEEDELDLDTGFDSGYETDPVDRFLKINSWQKQLGRLQMRLRESRLRSREGGTSLGTAVGRAGKSLKPLVDRAGGTLREIRARKGEQLRNRRVKLVGTLQQTQQNYEKQVKQLRAKLDKVLVKARSAKMKQLQHMICFCCSMMDLLISAFWLGASPQTYHWCYTARVVFLVGLRFIWYRCNGWHYYLFDLCYYSNLALLLYIWVFPTREEFFMAVHGFSGVLMLSVIVFRNSFVPHCLDRMTSYQIHISPAMQIWALRWYADPNGPFRISARYSPMPAIYLYILWMSGYYSHQFIFVRKRIERKGYATLYQYMAHDMGILKSLPKALQGPVGSRIVFIFGHCCLFIAGLPCVYLPFGVHTAVACFTIFWAFKNGAAFYITYFWKVYDNQIHAFESQMDQAVADTINLDAVTPASQNAMNGSPSDH